MSILSNIRYGLARWAYKAAQFRVVPTWVRQSFLEPTFRNLVRDGYQKNAAVFACISALAFAFPEAPLVVLRERDEEPLPQHPLRSLIRRPNKLMGEAELKAITIVYAAIGGNAYWHKIRTRRGIVELWPYHAGYFTAVPGGDNWISHYVYDETGSGACYEGLPKVPVEDIVHFKWPSPDPGQPWQAMPPLRPAAREVDSDNEATRYLFTLLKNDAVPRTILTTPADRNLSDDEVKRMRAQFKDRYGGDNRGDVAILEGGTTMQRLGLDLEQLAFEALHNLPEARIAAAFRVPPIIAGLNVGLQRSTFANYGEARKAFTQDTLVPLWVAWASEIEADPDLNPTGELVRMDTSRVAALQEDENRKWTRVINAVAAGLLDEDEGRAEIGKPKRERKPEPAPPAPAADPNDTPPATAGQQPAPRPSEEQAKAAAQRREIKAGRAKTGVNRLGRIRRELQGRMERSIESFFADLATTVAARAEKGWTPALERKELPPVEQLLQLDDATPLKEIARRYYAEIIESSWETWNQELGVEVAFDIDDPAVAEALRQAENRMDGVLDTTWSAIADYLATAAADGLSQADMIRGLKGLVEETYKGRAKTTARTELATAQNMGAHGRYAAAGVSKVRVFDGDDDGPCAAVNNTVQTIAWMLANLLEHPNCTRAFAAEFDEE